jgi:amino acid permease
MTSPTRLSGSLAALRPISIEVPPAQAGSTSSLHHAPRATVFESFSTTAKCIIGSGIMSLPYAFLQSGWLVGVLFLLVIALLSYSTMSLIIAAVHLTRGRLRRRKAATAAHAAALAGATFGEPIDQAQTPAAGSGDTLGVPRNTSYGSLNSDMSGSPGPRAVDPLDLTVIEQDPDLDVIGYQQVAYVAYGEWGRISADTVLIFCQVGSCAAFLVLVLTNIQACLASYGHQWPLSWIAIPLAPIVLMLSLPRSTTYLAPAAHFGNLTLLVGVATIVYYGVTSKSSYLDHVHTKGLSNLWHVISELPMYSGHPFGILVFFGISAFAFAAHCEIVAVEADSQSRKVYQMVLPSALVFIACLYVSVGVFAYACFGEHTEANILLNLGTSTFVNLVRIALSCTLLVNFALALFPASQTLDLLIAGPAPVSRDLPHQHENTPRRRSRQASRAKSTGTEGAASPVPPIDEEAGGDATRTSEATESTSLLAPSAHHRAWPSSGSEPPTRSRESSNGLPPVGTPSPWMPPDSPSPVLVEHEHALEAYHRKGNLIRILVVAGTFAIGLLIQDLGVLFSLVGSVAGGILCFTMPPLFWYRVSIQRKQVARAQFHSLPYADASFSFPPADFRPRASAGVDGDQSITSPTNSLRPCACPDGRLRRHRRSVTRSASFLSEHEFRSSLSAESARDTHFPCPIRVPRLFPVMRFTTRFLAGPSIVRHFDIPHVHT